MSKSIINISDSTEIGSLGVMHLKRYWQKCQLKKDGSLASDAFPEEWNIDITLLSALGLGLEQTLKEIYNSLKDFNDFENWVLYINNGELPKEKIEQFNRYIHNRENGIVEGEIEKVLDELDISFWNENGYLIIRNVISGQDCEDTINAICDFIDIERDDPSTWYNNHPFRQGIMVQLFQHPALEKNRLSSKIRKAYEQLWSRKDLWVNTDRVGFNPPETSSWKFPGPKMHWDVSLAMPIPFGLQGILYLADTASNQGAFTLVPGFHNKIESWLGSLLASVNPRNEDIYAMGTKPIEAKAGDFIIWHQALPHGSSPNTSELPRFVQYINYAPLDAEVNDVWI
jgi:hypothetical protein